ncbi:MAG: hypothetical protein J6D37_06755 [Clostridia bacterium]|nr:hypothetical protein [Clostridia bacterium]
MKTNRKTTAIVLSLFLCSGAMLNLCACNGEATKEPESPYEFVFTGSTVIADQTYHLTVYGNKDEDKTFDLRVAEMPVAELNGTWVYVEGKGYKLYFDDTNSTFVYTKYDTATNEFSFKYTLNIGDTNGGSGKAVFTYKDEAFAKKYDGEGLGAVPPTFTGYSSYIGAMFALHEPVKCILTCYEDGTCTSISTNEVKFASPRNGTWSYDSAKNSYHFTFEAEPYGLNEEGTATYWKYSQPIGTSLEDSAANWMPFDGYWVSGPITEIPGNEYETYYDAETNTYYLCFEHGFSGFGEFADRYVAYTPED